MRDTPTLARRQAGVLLHPSSLPGRHGTGDLGPAARAFVDALARAGVRLWQVLPLVPPGDAQALNPYVSWSALAGNPQLLSLDDLHAAGLLEANELEGPPSPEGWLDLGPVRAFKAERVRRAARRLLARERHPWHAELEHFVREAPWARQTALFAALAQANGTTAWWTWADGALARAEPAAVAQAARTLATPVHEVVAEQFLFEQQWAALRRHARERQVALLGDVPIYVTARSADTWLHQEQFHLEPDGTMAVLAGCPPDAFAADGQLWGNPLYRWEVMAADGYRWWVERLRRAFHHADFVRLDHFRAFSAYWEIPAGQSATRGRWVPGPGLPFFEALRAALGPCELCAEDLGDIDAPVLALRDALGLPGMCILQFAFDGDPHNPHLPHCHQRRRLAYPGNHDNDTAVGWWQTLAPGARSQAQRYLGRHGDDIAWDLIRAALSSVADVAIVQAQDLLSLGSEARMNHPPSYAWPLEAQRNWRWRLLPGQLGDAHLGRLGELLGLYGRA